FSAKERYRRRNPALADGDAGPPPQRVQPLPADLVPAAGPVLFHPDAPLSLHRLLSRGLPAWQCRLRTPGPAPSRRGPRRLHARLHLVVVRLAPTVKYLLHCAYENDSTT